MMMATAMAFPAEARPSRELDRATLERCKRGEPLAFRAFVVRLSTRRVARREGAPAEAGGLLPFVSNEIPPGRAVRPERLRGTLAATAPENPGLCRLVRSTRKNRVGELASEHLGGPGQMRLPVVELAIAPDRDQACVIAGHGQDRDYYGTMRQVQGFAPSE